MPERRDLNEDQNNRPSLQKHAKQVSAVSSATANPAHLIEPTKEVQAQRQTQEVREKQPRTQVRSPPRLKPESQPIGKSTENEMPFVSEPQRRPREPLAPIISFQVNTINLDQKSSLQNTSKVVTSDYKLPHYDRGTS